MLKGRIVTTRWESMRLLVVFSTLRIAPIFLCNRYTLRMSLGQVTLSGPLLQSIDRFALYQGLNLVPRQESGVRNG